MGYVVVRTPREDVSSHGAERTEADHAVIHSLIREVFVGLLCEEVLLADCHHWLVDYYGDFLVFDGFWDGDLKGSGDFGDQIGLLLLDSDSVDHPEGSLTIACVHG